jgi:hypothetical protein
MRAPRHRRNDGKRRARLAPRELRSWQALATGRQGLRTCRPLAGRERELLLPIARIFEFAPGIALLVHRHDNLSNCRQCQSQAARSAEIPA